MLPSDLPIALARALETRGYTDLTPVQLAVAKPETVGRDLMVSARTGSGKTVAYGLAFAEDLMGVGETLPPADAPLALVIAPTRELALQVQRELEWLYAGAGAKVVSCVGGMDPRKEQRALNVGAHIVVGTPGRLRDHLERGNLEMTSLAVVVLDEADEMLDLGFREELEALLDAAPAERRTLMFSATLPKPIVAMARAYQKDALRITAGTGPEEGHADIEYRAVPVAPSDVEHAVVNLLRFYEAGAALVFCSTREAVRRLHANLVERGFSVVALSGELTQNERTHALQALRDRRARVCVATDVAARGIDIPDLELVIHAELPHDGSVLQHRSGRTGRAGRKGVSVLLVPYPRRRRAEAMLRNAKIDAAWAPAPSAEDIRAKDQERLIAQLRPDGEAAEDDLAIARALLADGDAETVVASLVRARRAAMPSPEDMAEAQQEYQPAPRPAARPGFENTQWFAIDLGRSKNAEARWLLPLICRRGHVTKSEIGAIRVFDRETRFEIVRAAADRFMAAVAKAEDDGVNITPLADPDLPPQRDRKPFRKKSNDAGAAPRQERSTPSAERAPRPERSRDERPQAERPQRERPEHARPERERPERERPERTIAPRQAEQAREARPDAPPAKPFKPRPPKPEGAKPYAGKLTHTSKKQGAKLSKTHGKKPNGKPKGWA